MVKILEKCVGCGKCREICPFDAIKKEKNKFVIDNNKCQKCYFCVNACPFENIDKEEDSDNEEYEE